MTGTRIVYGALTASRWPDLERLFGPRGACGGCWCMYWRLSGSGFQNKKGSANRRSFKRIVESGARPGVLAYCGAEPVGWCAVEPRESYPRLARSRILEPVDDRPVWSVTCLFVKRGFRTRGISVGLLKTAVEQARSRGARIVEGYPVEPRSGTMPDAFAWTGLASAFLKAGFEEVARRSPTRPIMRRVVRPAAARRRNRL